MKLCNDEITFSVLGEPDADGYDTYTEITVKASWFRQENSSVNAKGMMPSNTVIVRIPAENVPDGLEITKGMQVSCNGETASVIGWTDNRRAQRGKHIKVVCA